MNRRTAMRLMALGLGTCMTRFANAEPLVEKQAVGERALSKGNMEFATDLYAKLRDKERNLFLSPLSISTALAMTYAGARGQTALEMAKTLHFNLDPAHLHPAYAALMANLMAAGKKSGCELFIANALWGQHGYHFLPDFINLAKKNYGAGVYDVDFVGHSEEARRTINAWVAKQTKDKIKELLQRGVLTSDTRLVLTNAIYFKSNWHSPFKKQATREEDFTITTDQKVRVPLMHQSADFGYLDGGSFQALDLLYAGKELSMTIFLPKKMDGLAEFEKTLTAGKLAEWLSQLRSSRVDTSLPKFKMTTTLNLGQVLSGLGMATAFSRGADFSGMTASRELFISEVIHKAYVAVQEEGTEAAAATGVVMERLSVKASSHVFRADHPFVFVIRDLRSNSISFMGRVTDPQG
jgi:serine protease inhibitor